MNQTNNSSVIVMNNNNNRSDSTKKHQKYTDLLMIEPISPVHEDQNDNQDNHMNDALHQHNSQHNSSHHSQHHSQQQQYFNYQLLLSKQYEKYLSQLPAKQREYHELVLSATNSPLYQQINGPLLLAQQQKHLIQQQYQQQLKQQKNSLQNNIYYAPQQQYSSSSLKTNSNIYDIYRQQNVQQLYAQQKSPQIQPQYQQKQQYSQQQNIPQQNSGIKLIPTTKRSPTIETIQLNRHQMNKNAIISQKVRILSKSKTKLIYSSISKAENFCTFFI